MKSNYPVRQIRLLNAGAFLLCIALLFFPGSRSFAQPNAAILIPPDFYGINYWMPDSVGGTYPNGCINTNSNVIAKINDSGVKIIRVGGGRYDKEGGNIGQLLEAVDQIRNTGAEPLIQVPVKNNNYGYTATQAAALVNALNDLPPFGAGLGIKYFSIGNEYSLYNNANNRVDTMAAKFKRFAWAMKVADPTIKIVGPDDTWFDSDDVNGYNYLSEMVGNPGGPYDLTALTVPPADPGNPTYYLDIISWHTYPWNDSTDVTSTSTYNTMRSTKIGHPAGGFASDVAQMVSWINAANSFHTRVGSLALKFAVTEMNVTYKNAASGTATYNNSEQGISCASFFAGQFWADMYSQMLKNGSNKAAFMIPWSIHESGGDRGRRDLGWLDEDCSNADERSTYWHSWLLSNFFSGQYFNGTTTNTNVKAFGSRDGCGTAVMILNQNTDSLRHISVKLNSNSFSTPYTEININTGLTQLWWDSIHYDTVGSQSTLVLLYDWCGKPRMKYRYNINHNLADSAPQSEPITVNIGGVTLSNCLVSPCDRIMNDTLPSAAEEQGLKNYKISPNPNNGNMNFDYALAENERGVLSLHDITGRKLSEYLLEPEKTSLPVNENNLQSGMYFYTVMVNGKTAAAGKLVIVK